MKLILNGINNGYLRDIVADGKDETERVDAAVAYGTGSALLFDWCHDNQIPLRFGGRYDDGVPVALSILKRFLQDHTGISQCRLVRHLHAKVIWWRGYGVYIGSANLTQSAWWNNVEAGVFFTEYEICEAGHGDELEDLFRVINEHSSPLTDEVYRSLELRQNQLNTIYKGDRKNATDTEDNINISPWPGLSGYSATSSSDRRRNAFIREWNSTLQIMRGMADTVSESFRPSWVRSDVPRGAQVDQFLHAHYYQRTFDGRQAAYEFMFERNRTNPNPAVIEAMHWWKSLPHALNSEDMALNEWAPMLARAFLRSNLHLINNQILSEIFLRVNAAREYAARVPNAQVGLPDSRKYTREEKIAALAARVSQSRSAEGRTFVETIDFVLYGGAMDDLPLRLWEATNSSEY
jgi:hypothetical protein